MTKKICLTKPVFKSERNSLKRWERIRYKNPMEDSTRQFLLIGPSITSLEDGTHSSAQLEIGFVLLKLELAAELLE